MVSFSRQHRTATKPVVLVFVEAPAPGSGAGSGSGAEAEKASSLEGAAAGTGNSRSTSTSTSRRRMSAEQSLDFVCRQLDSFACGVVYVQSETAETETETERGRQGMGIEVVRGYGVATLPAVVLLPAGAEGGPGAEVKSAVVLQTTSTAG